MVDVNVPIYESSFIFTITALSYANSCQQPTLIGGASTRVTLLLASDREFSDLLMMDRAQLQKPHLGIKGWKKCVDRVFIMS